MAKAAAPKKATPKPKLSDKEQSARFIATARALGVEESGKNFTETVGKLLPPKKT